MNELKATITLFEGTPFEIKSGKTIYWKNSIYSENWQSWTIAIYHKVDNKFEYFNRITQRDFTREVQRMNDLSKSSTLFITPK